MTKQKQSEQAEYIAKLRETLQPGDTLHTVLRSVSRSGMSRVIDVYKLECNGNDGVRKQWLSYWIAKACDFTFNDKRGEREGIKIGGCGSDMGFEIVYNLGRVLFPIGFPEKCTQCGRLPTSKTSVDEGQPDRAPQCNRGHSFRGRNGNTTGWDNDGGYALKQEWL